MVWEAEDLVEMGSADFKRRNAAKLGLAAPPVEPKRVAPKRREARRSVAEREGEFVDEDAFCMWVVRTAQDLGWRARTILRTRVHARVTERGEPDVLFWHPENGQMFAAELKMDLSSSSTGYQLRTCVEWISCGMELHVWTPADAEAIKRRLTEGERADLSGRQEALAQRVTVLLSQ